MDIELRNISYCDGDKTISIFFRADLFITKVKVGVVEFLDGELAYYHSFKPEHCQLSEEADKYCKSLPPKVYPSPIPGGDPVSVDMSLQSYVEGMIYDYAYEKIHMQNRSDIEHDMEYSILFGPSDMEYRKLKYSYPIPWMLQYRLGRFILKMDIKMKVLPSLAEGEVILNTNISDKVIRYLDLPEDCWAERPSREGYGKN